MAKVSELMKKLNATHLGPISITTEATTANGKTACRVVLRLLEEPKAGADGKTIQVCKREVNTYGYGKTLQAAEKDGIDKAILMAGIEL